MLPDCGADAGRTFRDLVHQVPGMSADSPADLELVRRTLKDMAKAGELRRVGSVRVAGACRPATLYAPKSAGHDAAAHIQSILSVWR